MHIRFTWIILAGILLVACNSGSNCYESSETLLITTFSDSHSNKIGPLLVKGYGRNGAGDTLFFSKDSALTKRAGLPLSLLTDSTGFSVTANGKSGILWLRHSMNFQLISQSCGFAPYYTLKAARYSALVDSLRLYNGTVDPKSAENYATNGQNIQVYLHLAAN